MKPMTVGAAMRAARGDKNQGLVARKMGVGQPQVSKWERDEQRPSFEQLAAFEWACDRPLGSVLRAAGYVEEISATEDVIRADLRLQHQGVNVVLGVLQNLVEPVPPSPPKRRAAPS